jgi:outer membrane protein TolC
VSRSSTTLEDQLNINNQNIAQFFQNFMAARAQVGIARASYFPTLTTAPLPPRGLAPLAPWETGVVGTGTGWHYGGGTSTGAGTAVGTSGSTFNEFQMPFDVSWEPDLWGRVRNTVREARYAAQVSAADLENERLTEQAALAEFYFQLRGRMPCRTSTTRPSRRRRSRWSSPRCCSRPGSIVPRTWRKPK